LGRAEVIGGLERLNVSRFFPVFWGLSGVVPLLFRIFPGFFRGGKLPVSRR
jgi:hypothetical protein